MLITAYLSLGLLTLIHLANKDRIDNCIQILAVVYAWPICVFFELVDFIKRRMK